MKLIVLAAAISLFQLFCSFIYGIDFAMGGTSNLLDLFFTTLNTSLCGTSAFVLLGMYMDDRR